MKIKKIINLTLIATLGLASCSKNDDIQNTIDNTESSDFKKLASVVVDSPEGTNESEISTRTSASINEKYNPTSKYYLNYVNLLAAEVGTNLIEKPEEENYTFTTSQLVKHEFTNNPSNTNYDVYFKIIDEKTNDGGSNSGTIILSSDNIEDTNDTQVKNDIKIKLTTFKDADLQDLKVGEQINNINNFYFGGNNTNGIGSVLFYLTYNPNDGVITLPEINKDEDGNEYDFLNILKKGNGYSVDKLYNENPDNLFVSEELLIAATNDKVYIFETIKNNVHNGYKLLREYDRDNSSDDFIKEDRMEINMKRLTTIVNASFLIEDTYTNGVDNGYGGDSFYDPNDSVASLDTFEKRYGFRLDGMTCPYATIDGVASTFDINNKSDKNTGNPCRVVLWAKGLEVKGPDGKSYTKEPHIGTVSMKTDSKVYWGFGANGNSYSVLFKGIIKDGNQLSFYTNIAGKNIIITTELYELTLLKNKAHNITLLVDAKKLKEAVKPNTLDTRANSNDFVELRVPSENLIIN